MLRLGPLQAIPPRRLLLAQRERSPVGLNSAQPRFVPRRESRLEGFQGRCECGLRRTCE